MAYASTISSVPVLGGCVRVTITETDVQTDSEWGPLGAPGYCEIVAFRCDRVNGSTATRVDPVLGRAAGWDADEADHLLSVDWGIETPTCFPHVATTAPLVVGDGGEIYGRTNPDGAGDDFTTELILRVRDAPARP